jgi:hypothetical protein
MLRRWGRRFPGVVALSAGLVLGGQQTASPAGGGPVAVRLVKIAHLDQPVVMAIRPGDDTFYIGQRGGRVHRVARDGKIFADAVVDLSSEVSSGAEEGLVGKVLRIDPRPTRTAPYRIPDDNPFVGRAGARPEVWMFGLRQPWRFSFDRVTQDFWVGDVGEAVVEEVDFLRAGVSGANFEWDALEGTHPHHNAPPPEAHVLPIFEYEHRPDRCAVIGGYAYHVESGPLVRSSYHARRAVQGLDREVLEAG